MGLGVRSYDMLPGTRGSCPGTWVCHIGLRCFRGMTLETGLSVSGLDIR